MTKEKCSVQYIIDFLQWLFDPFEVTMVLHYDWSDSQKLVNDINSKTDLVCPGKLFKNFNVFMVTFAPDNLQILYGRNKTRVAWIK